MARFDTLRELARMSRYGDQALALLEQDAELLAVRRAEISGWTPLEQLAHVALANELVLKNVRSLAQREGLLVCEGLEAQPQAIAVLAGGRIPRGRAQSPRMVRPPAEPVLADVTQWHRDNQAMIAALRASAWDMEPSRHSVPHQLLGPLDLAQWARFGSVHTRHHLEIAIEVLRAAGVDEMRIPSLEAIEAAT